MTGPRCGSYPGSASGSPRPSSRTCKGKLVQEALLRDAMDAARGGEPVPDVRTDAIDALIALQYPRREAQRVVASALAEQPDLVTLEDVLRYVLERPGRVSLIRGRSAQRRPSHHERLREGNRDRVGIARR